MHRPITIVGGGLAGLTLGIGLRQRGLPATIWEASRYPRHRVCGEFISGRGLEVLDRLGLMEPIRALGARTAGQAAFFNGHRRVASQPLPQGAMCISRFVLDQWLAQEFVRLGGVLNTEQRWGGGFGEGVVRATGRRPTAVVDGWRYFGLKVHARGMDLSADLEMHFVPSGYVGLCRLAEGETNICGLLRSAAAVPELAMRWREWLGGPVGSPLRERLESGKLEEDSFCSVAGICLRPFNGTQPDECCVGDSLTMVPPVTGNGMSMAFESAEVALDSVSLFSLGKRNWPEVCAEITSECHHRFAPRLRWASLLQSGLFHSRLRSGLMFLGGHSTWVWRGMFGLTR